MIFIKKSIHTFLCAVIILSISACTYARNDNPRYNMGLDSIGLTSEEEMDKFYRDNLIPIMTDEAESVVALQKPQCFLNADTNTYQFPNVSLGDNLHQIVEGMQADQWITRYEIERIIKSEATEFGAAAYYPIFGDMYTPGFVFNQDGNCYIIQMTASLVNSHIGYPVRTYNEACNYADEMFEQFVSEYGEPAVSNYGIYDLKDVPEDILSDIHTAIESGLLDEYPSMYSVWNLGAPNDETYLAISVNAVRGNGNSGLYFHISIGKAIEGADDEKLNAMFHCNELSQ